MPKSKRRKVVNPAQMALKRKGMEGKEKLAGNIRANLAKYKSVYVMRPSNMRNQSMKELGLKFKDTSKFCFGKCKVMQKGLVMEGKENVEELFPYMSGQCGLFFTNESKEKITKFFASYQENDFPRGGSIVDENIVIPQGFSLQEYESSFETRFRELGVLCKLNDGKIEVLADFVVAKAGFPLSVEQARLCKLLDKKISHFKIVLECHYNINDDTFEKLVAYNPIEIIRVNQPKPINHTTKKISKKNFDVLAEMSKFDVPMGNDDEDGDDIEAEDDDESDDDDDDDESGGDDESDELSDIYPDSMKEKDVVKAVKGKASSSSKGNSSAKQPEVISVKSGKGTAAPKAGNVFGQGKKPAAKGGKGKK